VSFASFWTQDGCYYDLITITVGLGSDLDVLSSMITSLLRGCAKESRTTLEGGYYFESK